VLVPHGYPLQAVIDGTSRDLHDLVNPVILSKNGGQSNEAMRSDLSVVY
jgi:hypothetical protein